MFIEKEKGLSELLRDEMPVGGDEESTRWTKDGLLDIREDYDGDSPKEKKV